jgi:hypothetical protein
MHPISILHLRALRMSNRLARATGATHVRVVITRRSVVANWLRGVAGLFDQHGWEV